VKKGVLIVLVLFILLTFTACSTRKKEVKSISLCSGAGLIKPINELITAFQKKYGIKVQVHYGGSAEIFGILQTTCGCDVFIPGAYKYTEDALKRGYIVKSSVKKVVLHIPVIIVPKGNPAKIRTLKDLAKPGVKLVLGDPKACAIGKVAKKILEKNHLWEKIKQNVIAFTPTVNQLLIYIATRQADASIIWADMVSWAKDKGKLEVIKIPKRQNIIKTIPTAVTTCAFKKGLFKKAKLLNDFISAPNSLKIWEKWGFLPCCK